jgi:hypothetical protein
MRTTTRLATLGLSILATSALLTGPAGAATATTTADQYGARANAESLTISIAGTQLTGSKASADLNNDPRSAAEATEVLTPAFAPDPLKAVATLANPTDVKAPATCTGNELEAVPGLGRVDITCASVAANITNSLPSAKALGAQIVLEPSVSAVLQTLGLQDTVTGATDQVFEQVIDPLVQALTGTPLEQIADDSVQTVQDVLDDTLSLQSTARIVVAPALAQVSTTADTVTSVAQSQGIRIELLPVDDAGATNGLLPDDLVPGKPLITITIGSAKAVSSYNRVTGAKNKPEAVASLVTIELGSVKLADALGLSGTKIEVPGGVEQCVLTGTPLETCVTVATAGVDADGNPYATSTSISLFKGVNGGIDLATGGVTSGAAGSLPAAVVAGAAPDLPRTGGNQDLAVIGGGLLALAVLVRRIVIRRAA